MTSVFFYRKERLISAVGGRFSGGKNQAASGQHNVGHKGVATRFGARSL